MPPLTALCTNLAIGRASAFGRKVVALVVMAVMSSSCSTPNDTISSLAQLTPAPNEYKTADSLVRYIASCRESGGWITSNSGLHSLKELVSTEARHSPGDIVQISVPDDTTFSGNYEINFDGRLDLPYAGSVQANGLTNLELETAVQRKLVSSGTFRGQDLRVSLLPVKWAPIQV